MAAQTVRYMTGTSKTLNHATLAKLFKGQSHLSIMPYASSGVTWADLSWSGADELYTIRDSFQIALADPTETEVKIDQKQEVVDTITENGTWTFAGNIPSLAAAVLNVFYQKGASVTSTNPILGQEGTEYTAQAYFATPKEVYATILVESEAQDLAIAFARVKLRVGGPNNDDNSNPQYLKMSGTILTNTESTGEQGDWAYCTK